MSAFLRLCSEQLMWVIKIFLSFAWKNVIRMEGSVRWMVTCWTSTKPVPCQHLLWIIGRTFSIFNSLYRHRYACVIDIYCVVAFWFIKILLRQQFKKSHEDAVYMELFLKCCLLLLLLLLLSMWSSHNIKLTILKWTIQRHLVLS